MVIEEDKVIELEDKSRHLLIKKVRCESVPYLICLRLGGTPVFELFRFGDDSVILETNPAVVSKVLDSYVSSDAYKTDLEKIDAAIDKYEKSIVSGNVSDEGDQE